MGRATASWGVAVAVFVLGANFVHGLAHAGQHVTSLAAWQWAYVAVVIYLAPVAAAVLLTRPRFRRAGAWLLLFSMMGAFAFDLAYHFVVAGPDNVFTLRPGTWRASFVGSAVVVSLLSGVGALVGVGLLTGSPRPQAVGARTGGDLAGSRPGSSTRTR